MAHGPQHPTLRLIEILSCLLFHLLPLGGAAQTLVEIKWKFEIPGRVATPAIGLDGTVFAAGGGFIVALDPATGKQRWKSFAGGPSESPISWRIDPATGLSQVDKSEGSSIQVTVLRSGAVLCLSETNLCSFNPTTGAKLWEIQAWFNAEPPPLDWWTTRESFSRLSVDQNDEIFLVSNLYYTEGVGNAYIKKLHPDGTTNSQFISKSYIHSITSLMLTADDTLAVTSNQRSEYRGEYFTGAVVHVIDKTTGAELRAINHPGNLFEQVLDSSGDFLGNALLFIPSLSEYGFLDYTLENRFAKLGINGINWEVKIEEDPIRAPAISREGFSLIPAGDQLYSISSLDGSIIWKVPIGLAQHSPSIGGNGIACIASSPAWGKVGLGGIGNVVGVNTTTGKIEWSINTPTETTSSPVIGSDGAVFIGTRDNVYAIAAGITNVSQGSWPMEMQNARNTLNHLDGEFSPSITVTNSRIEFSAGENIRISGKAYGPGKIEYQWEKDGTLLGGASENLLEIRNVQNTDRGFYRLWVSNSFGVSHSKIVNVVPRFTPRVYVGTNEVLATFAGDGSSLISIVGGFPNGKLFFTLDGSIPTFESPEYSSPFLVSNNVTVNVLALSDDFLRTRESGAVEIQVRRFSLLDVDIEGGGRVLRQPNQQRYFVDDPISLTAIPNVGWKFLGWEGDIDGSEVSRIVTVAETNRIRAVFERIPSFEFDVVPSGSGTVSIIPDRREFNLGDHVYVRACPENGWRFVRWDGDLAGRAPISELIVTSAFRLSPVFEEIPKHLIDIVSAGGVVSGGGYRLENQEIYVSASANSGWTFLGWRGDHSGGESSFQWKVTGPATFIAQFGTPVAASSVGPGRLVLDPDLPFYPYGTRVKVTPIPEAGHYLSVWGGAGDGQQRTGWELMVTNANPRITGLFSPLAANQVVLTVETLGGGTVTGAPPRMAFVQGESVTLTAVPRPGYSFAGWGGDASGVSSSVTIPMTAAKHVTAIFAEGVPGPSLSTIGDRSMNEGDTLQIVLSAQHPSQSTESLGFFLVESPDGMTLSPDRTLQWIPLESEGPGQYPVRIRVVDGAGLIDEESFVVSVTELNSPPVLLPVPAQSVSDGQTLSVTLSASDSDLPAQMLEFSIVSAPEGMSLTPGGVLSWIAPVGQGPSTNEVLVRVTDNGIPALSATNTLIVVAGSENHPPVFPGILDQMVAEGGTLTLQLEATDPDLPFQQLVSFRVSGPDGLVVSPSGALSWSPTEIQGPSTNEVVVRVSDNGVPAAVVTNAFLVVVQEVNRPPELAGWNTLADPIRFSLVQGPMSWDEARRDAESRGGHLATFASEEEWAAGQSVWSTYGRPVWLGGIQPEGSAEPGGGWSWITGEPWNYTAWSANEPNNFGGGLAENHLDILATGGWNDAPATTRLPYLLEFPLLDVIRPMADLRVEIGHTLGVSLAAQDSDIPANTPRMELESGPEGMVLTSLGALIWTTSANDSPSTNKVRIRLTDDGVPPASTTNEFNVVVFRLNHPPVLSGWSPLADPQRFALIQGTFTWEEARADAERRGGYLATFASREEWDAGKAAWTAFGKDTWLGAYQPDGSPEPGGNWTWITGEPWIFADWSANEPNNFGGGLSEGHLDILPTGDWNDAPQRTRQPYLIEYPEGAGAGPIGDIEVAEGGSVGFSLRVSDPDAAATPPTFHLLTAPVGMNLTPTGILTWTPTESDGPSNSEVTIVATDSGVPPLSTTNSFRVAVTEVNQPPTLADVPDQVIDEGMPFNLTLSAEDGDLPPQELTFEFSAGPSGIIVTREGLVTWLPPESQAPSTNEVFVIVRDNGVPSMSATNSFRIIVREVNVPPIFASVPPTSVNEGETLELRVEVTDTDRPPQRLVVTLLSGPPGLTVTPSGGVSWTPSEAQGPSSNEVTVIVTDDGIPPLSATNSFQVVVVEVNQPPVLPDIPEQQVDEETLFTLNLTALDSDLPAQTLSFRLISGPDGLSVSPSGLATWSPLEQQAPSTNEVTIVVTDSGIPPLSATNTFRVVVREVNSPPSVPPVAGRTTREGEVLSFKLVFEDRDIPPQQLVASLVNGPAGLTLTPSGDVSWIPAENQGPSTNEVIFAVTDSGTPSISTTNQFLIIVQEVNLRPTIATIADQTLDPGSPLTLTLEGSDPDLPKQELTFALLEGPAGLLVGTDGRVSWTPTSLEAGTTNDVRVLLTDGELTAPAGFRVVVRDPTADITPKLMLKEPRTDGRISLEIRAPALKSIILESSPQMTTWNELQSVLGLGMDTPVTLVLTPDAGSQTRFLRARIQ